MNKKETHLVDEVKLEKLTNDELAAYTRDAIIEQTILDSKGFGYLLSFDKTQLAWNEANLRNRRDIYTGAFNSIAQQLGLSGIVVLPQLLNPRTA